MRKVCCSKIYAPKLLRAKGHLCWSHKDTLPLDSLDKKEKLLAVLVRHGPYSCQHGVTGPWVTRQGVFVSENHSHLETRPV